MANLPCIDESVGSILVNLIPLGEIGWVEILREAVLPELVVVVCDPFLPKCLVAFRPCHERGVHEVVLG